MCLLVSSVLRTGLFVVCLWLLSGGVLLRLCWFCGLLLAALLFGGTLRFFGLLGVSVVLNLLILSMVYVRDFRAVRWVCVLGGCCVVYCADHWFGGGFGVAACFWVLGARSRFWVDCTGGGLAVLLLWFLGVVCVV